MKRVAPILLGLAVLAGAKKKAMMAGGNRAHRHGADVGPHQERRQRWEERARAWHEREHEIFEA